MSARTSSRLASPEDSEGKWDSHGSRLRGKDEVKSSISRSTRERMSSTLEQAKRNIDAVEDALDDEEDLEDELDDDEDEDEGPEEEGVVAGLRSRSRQAKRALERESADLRIRGTAIARDAQAKGNELMRDAEDVAEDLQERGAKAARRGKQALQQKKAELQDSMEASDDDEQDEEEEEEGSNWQSNLLSKGSNLLHAASNATSSIRSRIVDAAPGLEKQVKRGVRVAREKLAQVDFEDGDMEAERDDEEGEEEEEDDGSEEEEQEEDVSENDGGEESLSSRLRSAKRAGRQMLSDARRSDIASQARNAVGRGKRALDDALHSDTVGQMKSGVRAAMSQVRSSGERSADRVRSTVAQFDFDDDARFLEGDDGDIAAKTVLPARTRAKLSHAGESLKDRASSVLHEVEEELGLTDEAFNKAAAHALDKFDEVVEKDGNMRLPVIILGCLIALWAIAAGYQLYNPNPAPPPTLLDSATTMGHNMKAAGLDKLAQWEARGHEMVDRITGHTRPPTIGERLTAWLTPSMDNLDLAHAKDGLRQARDSVEEKGYAMKHRLNEEILPTIRSGVEGVKEFTKEKIIPGARDTAEQVQYHANHAGDYARNVRDAASNLGSQAQQKAQEYNLAPKELSLVDRVWAWATGASSETYPQQAVRKAGELKDRAWEAAQQAKDSLPHRSMADRIRSHLPGHHDSMLDKIERNIPNLDVSGTAQEYYDRAVAAGYELKDGAWALTHRSLSDRIRAHLPGHRDTVLDKLSRTIPNLDVSGTAQEYYDRAISAGYELRDGMWHKVNPSLMDRIKSHMPGRHESMLDKVARNIPNLDVSGTAEEYYNRALAAGYELQDGAYKLSHRSLKDRLTDSIRSHMPHDTVLERVQRNIPNVDVKGTAQEYYERARAAGYELRDGAYQKAHDLTHPSLSDRFNSRMDGLNTRMEDAYRNIPNLDIGGTAKEYADRARAAGYELRNGAWQLIDRAQQGAHDAVNQARTYADQLAAQAQPHAHPAGHLNNVGIPAEIHRRMQDNAGVPLSEVQSEIAGARPVDPQLSAKPIHVPDAAAGAHSHQHTAHRQTLAQQVKHALKDGVESIKSHLPGGRAAAGSRPQVVPAPSDIHDAASSLRDSVRDGATTVVEEVRSALPDEHNLHQLRKEAEYVVNRGGHKVEAAGHRVEEKVDYVRDNVKYHMPN